MKNWSKKKKVLFGTCYMLCGVLVFVLYVIIDSKMPAKYHYVKLQRVQAAIPIDLVQNDEAELWQGDKVFILRESNNAYLIVGMELQNLTESDVGKEYPFSSESLTMLQNAESSSQIIDGIKDGLGMMQRVESMGSIEKPSYTKYYFTSNEVMDGKSYQAYYMFMIHEDVKYMQINLVDEEHQLSEEQKRYMRLMTGVYKVTRGVGASF